MLKRAWSLHLGHLGAWPAYGRQADTERPPRWLFEYGKKYLLDSQNCCIKLVLGELHLHALVEQGCLERLADFCCQNELDLKALLRAISGLTRLWKLTAMLPVQAHQHSQAQQTRPMHSL